MGVFGRVSFCTNDVPIRQSGGRCYLQEMGSSGVFRVTTHFVCMVMIWGFTVSLLPHIYHTELCIVSL